MKPVLIATDVIEGAGRGELEAVATLQQVFENASPAISILTEVSLANKCKDSEKLDILLRFLSRFDVLPLNKEVSRKAVEIRRRCDLNTASALIAATAIVHGRSLIAANQDVFESLEELSMESYPLYA